MKTRKEMPKKEKDKIIQKIFFLFNVWKISFPKILINMIKFYKKHIQ